jgi:hypothetical protein
MATSKPKARFTVREGEGLEIVIPSHRNRPILISLAIFIAGWAYAEATTALELASSPREDSSMAQLVWLVGWTLAGATAIHTWLWGAFGREVVLVGREHLTVTRDILGFTRARGFDLARIKDLRAAPLDGGFFGWGGAERFWGMRGPAVSFEYDGKPFHFGAGVDDLEVGQIVSQIKARHLFE